MAEDTQLGESELPELPTSIKKTEMDNSTATSTTSIDEADTELFNLAHTLKGRRRPDIAHFSIFIRALKPIQAIEAGTKNNRSTRLSP